VEAKQHEHDRNSAAPGRGQPGQVYASENGRRDTYFRDQGGHLMEILTAGEPT
jgi:hypothetical protein